MSTLIKLMGFSIFFAGIYSLGLLLVTTPQQVNAQSSNSSTTSKTSTTSYNYKAQSGDSYTLMARKAIQTYGINEKVKLSPAQIIFAETNMTIEAGLPELVENQGVTISKSTVKKWVDAAKKLTDYQEAAWSTYVPYVDFNTDNVGQ